MMMCAGCTVRVSFERVEVYRVRVIEVDLLAVFQQGDVAVVPIVGILRDNYDLTFAEMLRNLLDYGGLS